MANQKVKRIFFDTKKFREEIFKKSFTYLELERKTNVSMATIFKALRDGHMTVRTYEALSTAIDIQVIDSRN